MRTGPTMCNPSPTQTRVCTLPDGAELEIRCRTCNTCRHEWARDLTHQARLGQLTIEDLEQVLACGDRRCGGAVAISVIRDPLHRVVPGFVAVACRPEMRP